MRKRLAFLTVTFVFGLCSLVLGASPESYFPLKEGMTWDFQNKVIDLATKNQIGTGKSIKKNLAPVELEGTKVVPQVFSFYEPATNLKQETTSFVAKDPDGFYVLARKSANDKEAVMLAQRYYVLKFPLTKGASWKQEIEGFVLQDTVESTDASVQVPAGTFKNCLVVKKLYFSPQNPKTILKETVLWFAPDVGNVKVVIKHPQENKEIVQELLSFKK